MTNYKTEKFNLKAILSYYYRQIEFSYYSLIRRKNKGPGLIILGCGRSGTTYTSKRFSSFGIDIGHERLKRHGISSWYLVSDQKKVPLGPSYKDISNLNLPAVHQVRHPLNAISSLQSTGWISWKFLSNEIPIDFENDSKVYKAMKYWFYWNKKAEEKSVLTYQVEEIDKILPQLLRIGNFQEPAEKSNVSKKTNTRKHIVLTWEDLEKEDIALTKKIKDLGKKYNYEI